MVINNWGHSQSALEHYMYFLKDCDKVWQWSCPAHLRQWLADNLQETGAGAGVIKSSLKDKAANWPCSNHWEPAAPAVCLPFCLSPASPLLLELPQHAGRAGGWQAGCGGCRQGSRECQHRCLMSGAPLAVHSLGGPGADEVLWKLLSWTYVGQQHGHVHTFPTALCLSWLSSARDPHIFICSACLPTQPSSLNRLIP